MDECLFIPPRKLSLIRYGAGRFQFPKERGLSRNQPGENSFTSHACAAEANVRLRAPAVNWFGRYGETIPMNHGVPNRSGSQLMFHQRQLLSPAHGVRHSGKSRSCFYTMPPLCICQSLWMFKLENGRCTLRNHSVLIGDGNASSRCSLAK